VQLGISTPWDLPRLAPDEQRQRCAEIADAGIDFVFTADHVSFHNGSGIDALVRLAAIGGMEPRLDLHVGVLLLALRHPMVVARQIATFAEYAPGRLTVGVGVGGEDRREFEVCEVDPATRGRRTDASLRIVRALLDGDTVDGDGEFYSFTDGLIRPVPEPRVPFVVGGRSNAALERAGRLGDGWLAAWCSPRRFREGISIVESVGDAPDGGWRHGLQLWVGIGADADEARGHIAGRMADFYQLDFSLFERYTPLGTADQIAEFLAPYVEAGATTLNLAPCGPDRLTEYETLAEVKRLLA
jgi:alkanesulfonate monooxygenase SsuD/methylene tetrahydromethanopterin reductase-like flavin-dependent oxidoreductase (luciferase family)